MALSFHTIHEYCLKKQENVTEDFPFDEETLVLRVEGKIFLLMDINARPVSINLKCDPERAVELRARYEAVQPGYHMNKKHWNTVTVDGTIPSKEIFEMIDHSFELVAHKPKKSRS